VPQQPPYPGYPPPQMQPGSQTNGLAIGSLICGIVGCAIITPLIGILLGVLGLKDAAKKGGNGRGMSIAGIILSLLWLGFFGLVAAGGVKLWNAAQPGKQVAEAFAKDLAAGSIDSAMSRCTSSVTRDEVDAASKQLQPLGSVSRTVMFGASVEASPGSKFWILGGAVTFGQNQGVPYQVKLVDEGGGVLKIDGFMFTVNNRPVTGGTTVNGGRTAGK
jgi:hypothetical protein